MGVYASRVRAERVRREKGDHIRKHARGDRVGDGLEQEDGMTREESSQIRAREKVLWVSQICADLGISQKEYQRRRSAVPTLRKIRAHNAANPIKAGWRGAVILGGWTGRRLAWK
jgi:hypothetical protein